MPDVDKRSTLVEATPLALVERRTPGRLACERIPQRGSARAVRSVRRLRPIRPVALPPSGHPSQARTTVGPVRATGRGAGTQGVERLHLVRGEAAGAPPGPRRNR